MFVAPILFAAALAPTPIPLDRAVRAFEEIRLASEEDGGRLWGVALYGPMIFVDPETRYAVGNVADADGNLKPEGGVFAGKLPPTVAVANTAVEWGGTRWTMVMWGSVAERSSPRRRLLFHECFHRIQDRLGFPPSNPDNSQLDTLEGRYWYLLELRALAAALREPTKKAALADAMAFRAKRRALFPGAAQSERALENHEGLAEYTGFALRGTADEETRLAVARRLDEIDRRETFVRSFAYNTGPAYGLLLDAAAPEWRRSFKSSDDFAGVLASAAGIKPAGDPVERSLAYDGKQLRAEEERRDHEQAIRVANYRKRLVDGALLEIPTRLAQFGFDPYTVVPLGKDGTVYPSVRATGDWGSIGTESGARVTPDFSMLIFGIEDRSRLILKPGWALVGGPRPGDLVLSEKPAK